MQQGGIYYIDKKDLQEIENIIDKKLDEKLDARFAKLTLELSEVLKDFTYIIDKRFEEQNKKIDAQNQKLDMQNKKLDFVVNCYKENLDKHSEYDNNLSKINSRLFDYNLRLDSLEGACCCKQSYLFHLIFLILNKKIL